MYAHSLRPVMNEPGSTPIPWKRKTPPATSNAMHATRAIVRTTVEVSCAEHPPDRHML